MLNSIKKANISYNSFLPNPPPLPIEFKIKKDHVSIH